MEVKSAGGDEYGQISSGCLTLTGRLGVFKLNEGDPSDPETGNGSIVNNKRSVKISWDTTELKQTFPGSGWTDLWRYSEYGSAKQRKPKLDPFDVFYLPVRVMDADPDVLDYERPMLTGLTLLPTGKKNGQFRRTGQFEISNHWIKDSVTPFTNPTNILDPRFYVSKHKNGEYVISII